MEKRKYQKSKRAQQQEQTRARIVEATMALHEELGPANTTIKAIAEKAGVQRLTVYRYFPDDTSLFQACSSLWMQHNPPPDSSKWLNIKDSHKQAEQALLMIYQYYRHTESMWYAIYRDVDEVEALKAPMAQFESYLDHLTIELLPAWNKTGEKKKRLQITIRHCVRFSTWQSLKQEQLSDKKMASLALQWLLGIN